MAVGFLTKVMFVLDFDFQKKRFLPYTDIYALFSM